METSFKIKKDSPFKEFVGFANVAEVFTSNSAVQINGVFQYDFINLSNVPVLINNTIFLDRYFSGTLANPTYLNTFYRWQPLMHANERDTSNYNFTFLDAFYSSVNAVHRLMVIKKVYSPPAIQSQF